MYPKKAHEFSTIRCFRRGATQEGRKESQATATRPWRCSVILLGWAVCVLLMSVGQAQGRGGVVKESITVYKPRKRKVNV